MLVVVCKYQKSMYINVCMYIKVCISSLTVFLGSVCSRLGSSLSVILIPPQHIVLSFIAQFLDLSSLWSEICGLWSAKIDMHTRVVWKGFHPFVLSNFDDLITLFILLIDSFSFTLLMLYCWYGRIKNITILYVQLSCLFIIFDIWSPFL